MGLSSGRMERVPVITKNGLGSNGIEILKPVRCEFCFGVSALHRRLDRH